MAEIKISDHFTMKKLAQFTFLPIITIILCSLYTIVDGFFVSNFCKETAFAGMNIAAPFNLIFAAFGYMIGEGGSALIGKFLGENHTRKAKELFSCLIVFSLILGAVLTIVGLVTFDPFLKYQGATGDLLNEARVYGTILICAYPLCILQFVMQEFMVAADKPELGIAFALIAGVVNIGLDALLICGFSMGVKGAAIGTALGQLTGAFVPIVYVLGHKEFKLQIVGFKIKELAGDILKTCTNGSSEMVSNIAAQVVCILYNYVLLKRFGEVGVSAYGVLQYVTMLFSCVFMGFDMGIIPVVAYHYGAENKAELKNIRTLSNKLIMIYSLVMAVLSFALAPPISRIFVGYNEAITDMSVFGLRVYSVAFIVIGYNFFGSALFTGLNNGGISAFLSTIRTFLLPVICLFICSNISTNGVWYSLPFAEIIAFAITAGTIILNRKKYGI